LVTELKEDNMNKEMKTYQFNMTISVKEDISEGEILDKLVEFAEVNGYLIGGGLEEVEFEYEEFMSTEGEKLEYEISNRKSL
jgi:hypothetical protein